MLSLKKEDSEVDSCSLRCSVFDLDNAFDRYYKNLGGTPKYKKYGVKNSYRTNCITSKYKDKVYENIKVDLDKKVITSYISIFSLEERIVTTASYTLILGTILGLIIT